MVEPGYNYRLSDIHSALGTSQLRKLPRFLARRRAIAARYDAAFADLPSLAPLAVRPGVNHAYHLYVVRLTGPAAARRDEAFARLLDAGIGVNVHYPPLNLHPYFRTRLGYYDTDVVTLFFPLLQSWLLAHWLAPGLRRLRFAPPGPADQEEAGPPAPASLGWPLAAGLLARLGGADWHGNLLDFYLLAAGIAALLALALARPGTRPRLLRGLAVLALAGFHGNVGLAAALGLALVPRLLPRLAFPGRFGTAALALLLLAALAVPGRGLMERAAGKFAMYSKATVEVAEESAGRNPESAPGPRAGPPPVYPGEIGRAPCRERV